MFPLPAMLPTRQTTRAALSSLCLLLAAENIAAQDITKQLPAVQTDVQLSYAPLVKAVTPAVVNVYASRIVRSQPKMLPFNDPFFREFFGNDFSAFGAPRERMQRSLGSGVIVDPSGIIITNNHVIEGMTDVRIALADKREFAVQVILRDPRSDLAVLRIEQKNKNFPALQFNTGENTEVGDLVLAVGNPFGLGQTVTTGIISAVRQVSLSPGEQRVFLQTDAAINQGNSGGALVDMQGKLIGINTAIFSRSGGSDGIGFAIPASIVRYVLDAALAGKSEVIRPWLGAQMQPITAEIAETLNLDRLSGALVTDVTPASPAEKAGLKAGDIITAVNGKTIDDPATVTFMFTTRPVGDKLEFTLSRNGKLSRINIAIETAPETVPRDERKLSGRGPLSGATLINISPAVSEEMGLDGANQGVVISAVETGSLAERAGFQKKDRILALNNQQIASTAELEKAYAQADRLWRLTIERSGRLLTQTFRF